MPTWEDLDLTDAPFTKSNMLIPYTGGISKQFLGKIVKNTGFNYFWGRPVIMNNTHFIASGDIYQYDSERNYQNVTVIFWIATTIPGGSAPETLANGWCFPLNPTDPDEGGIDYVFDIFIVTLTTSWFDITGAIPGTRAVEFDIRANSSGTGFEVQSSANDLYLRGVVWRIENNMVDAGTKQ